MRRVSNFNRDSSCRKVVGGEAARDRYAPYMRPPTELVTDYIAAEGFQVVDSVTLEISDNPAVARHDPGRLPEIVANMDFREGDTIVLSACVQMPSLVAVARVEAETRQPILTALDRNDIRAAQGDRPKSRSCRGRVAFFPALLVKSWTAFFGDRS
jgi:hypothetical protein